MLSFSTSRIFLQLEQNQQPQREKHLSGIDGLEDNLMSLIDLKMSYLVILNTWEEVFSKQETQEHSIFM